MHTSILVTALAASSVLAGPVNKRILPSNDVNTVTTVPTASSSVETATVDVSSTVDTATSDSPSASSTASSTSSSTSTSTSTTTTSTTSTATASATPTNLATSGSFTYQGCYSGTTKTGGRTVKALVSAGKWTVDSCLAAVAAADYAVGGVTYGGECWGSNTVPSASLASTSCNWSCNDNHSQLCGGQSAISVYVSKQTTKLTDDENWSYTGCYSDNVGGVRTLPNLQNIGGKWTVQACLAAVKSARHAVGGLEYGGECWGADQINGNAPTHSSASCNMACNDDATLSCGGNNLLDVYTLKTSDTKAVDETWGYKGCYSDSVSARSLPVMLSTGGKGWTATACLETALAANYTMAGLIYGGECWAGSALASTASKLTGSRCAWSCNDDSSETCGGQSGLDVYYRS